MPAAAAGVFHGEGRQLSFAESLHGRAHGGIIAREVNLDAHLIEAHERTHTHATGEEGGYVVKFKAIELWEQLRGWLEERSSA